MLDSSWGVTQEQYTYFKIYIVYLKSVFTVTKLLRITVYILCEKMRRGRGRHAIVPNSFYYIFVFNTVLQIHNK